jgi:PIN domain nuclease of toxin-antitoxin system
MGGRTRLRLLLDSHIWLWLVDDPKRLGRRTIQELKDENNEVWLSPISTWEILTLHQKGRIKLHGDIDEWVAQAVSATKLAPFTHEVALAGRQFPYSLDPADRFLSATALVFDLTLVTADERLLGLRNIKTLASR